MPRFKQAKPHFLTWSQLLSEASGSETADINFGNQTLNHEDVPSIFNIDSSFGKVSNHSKLSSIARRRSPFFVRLDQLVRVGT